jgi:hypothetical protein
MSKNPACRISLFIFAWTILAGPALLADRAHTLAQKASKVEVESCEEEVDNFEDCHDNHLTGCSLSDNPKYDAYLNYLKNQSPSPTLHPVRFLTKNDFTNLEGQTPDTLKKGNHALHATELAGLGEGNIYGLIGYLYYAVDTGKKSEGTKGETCNCQLIHTENSDFHLGIGFDAAVAKKIRDGETVPKKDLEQTGIVVEMTPHYRAIHHTKWTFPLVQGLAGKQVKVIGQLLIDNEHRLAKDNCADPNADENKCWRASIWELHPVIQFYVCKTTSPCSPNSANWEKIDICHEESVAVRKKPRI